MYSRSLPDFVWREVAALQRLRKFTHHKIKANFKYSGYFKINSRDTPESETAKNHEVARFIFFPYTCYTPAFVENIAWVQPTGAPKGFVLLAGRFGKNSMSLEGKCCLEIDNSECMRGFNVKNSCYVLLWPSDLLYVMLAGCDRWISIRSVDNIHDSRKFWKRFRGCFVFESRVSTKTVVKDAE